MPDQVLAGCSYGGDCPRIAVLTDGRVAVTGALPDGREATVAVSRALFDTAARAWVAASEVPLPGGREAADG